MIKYNSEKEFPNFQSNDVLWLTKRPVTPSTVLPAKSDSDFMFCLQSYQGLIIDSSIVN